MPWYLYLALKQLFSSGQRLFFTVISTVSVALGVMLLIVVMSVMGGFRYQIRQKIVDTQGDLQVRASGYIQDSKAVEKIINAVPGVEASSSFAQGVVMLEKDQKPSFPSIQGLDMRSVGRVIPLNRYIIQGSLQDLDDDAVILSSQLALSLGARVGDLVQIYTPLMLEVAKGQDEVLLPTELKVIGIFEIGHQQLDSSTVIVTLRRMQQLYGLGQGVHGINVRISRNQDADQVTQRINDVLEKEGPKLIPYAPGLRARSWSELNQEFLWVLQLEKNIMTVILLAVVIVAAFLTMSLLLVLVLKKTREIGLLNALGATRRQIALCFCVQGISIGIVGTIVGLILGFTFLHFRNDVVLIITRFTGSQAVLERFYQFSEMPAHTEISDLVIIVIAAIVLSTLAGLIPAFIAAKLKPVEALRNE
jgi:lipoprotein-releasing system permease protein